MRANQDEMFDKVDSLKKQVIGSKEERISKIFERRNCKDELKDKVLKEKELQHCMLVEVHNCRQTNQQTNFQKEQDRMKKYQQELAFKLELQKHKINAENEYKK